MNLKQIIVILSITISQIACDQFEELQTITHNYNLTNNYEKINNSTSSSKQWYLETFLDINKDGNISLFEWTNELRRQENNKTLDMDAVKFTFDFYDKNQDGIISQEEFMNGAATHLNKKDNDGIPVQLHLGFTIDPTVMQIMWVVKKDQSQLSPVVEFGDSLDNLNRLAKGTYHTYNVGWVGFHGMIYVAYMDNLDTYTQYYYRVGDSESKIYSEVYPFRTAPKKGENLDLISIAMYGDQGTIIPFSAPVNDRITKDNDELWYDFTLLVGDIAYAGVSSEEWGEWEPIWNIYGEQIESWSNVTPFMPGVGNHEKYYNYTAYKNRYILPRSEGSGQNFWWSYDYGQIHFTIMSTEHDYDEGSIQYEFLENDLKKAYLDPNVKWIIFGGHRPMLCSLDDQLNSHLPDSHLISVFEPLFKKYHVDIVMNGHQHCYERTYPVYKGVPEMKGNTFYNPSNPIYITQGNAGALIDQKWVEPQPDWSAFRVTKYGYGRFQLHGNGTIHYSSIFWTGEVLDEFWLSKSITE